jgi:hypothetical protein
MRGSRGWTFLNEEEVGLSQPCVAHDEASGSNSKWVEPNN